MYLFIISAGRSGSTLLDIITGQHKDIVSLGEIAHLPKNITLNTVCGCGAKVGECLFWQKIFLRLEQKSIAVKNDPYSFNLGFPLASTVIDRKKQTFSYKLRRKLMSALQYLLLSFSKGSYIFDTFKERINNSKLLFDEILAETNAKVIVDSSKDPLRAVIFYLLNRGKAKIVLLSRDGRGVLYSIQKQRDKKISGILGWRRFYKKAFKLLRLVDKKDLLVVRYDDLVKDFDKTTTAIFQFAGVEKHDLNPAFIKADHHILNGNDLRLKKEISIRYDDEWKSKLDANSKKYFRLLAKRMNTKLGYDIGHK